MSLNTTPQTVTADTYACIFELERLNTYWTIDAVEASRGFAIDKDRLEAIARVLACPFKAAAPNWQHGRVIYAVARHYFSTIHPDEPVNLLDIGTAKGFSALCLEFARRDAMIRGRVTSVDVMPPGARVRRNTVAEVDHLCTLEEILAPFPEARTITFVEADGGAWLKRHPVRVHVAFVDGKHSDDAVWLEGRLLAARQEAGDVVIFDDFQVPGVAAAITRLDGLYAFEHVFTKPGREYMIGVRR